MVRRLKGVVKLNRADAAGLKVTAMDGNGYPVVETGRASRIELRPDTLYQLIAA